MPITIALLLLLLNHACATRDLGHDMNTAVAEFATIRDIVHLGRTDTERRSFGTLELKRRHAKIPKTTIYTSPKSGGLYYQSLGKVFSVPTTSVFSYRKSIAPSLTPLIGNGFSFVTGWYTKLYKYNSATMTTSVTPIKLPDGSIPHSNPIVSAIGLYPNWEYPEKMIVIKYRAADLTYTCGLFGVEGRALPCDNPPFPAGLDFSKMLSLMNGTHIFICFPEAEVIASLDLSSDTNEWNVVSFGSDLFWMDDEVQSFFVNSFNELCLSTLGRLGIVSVYCLNNDRVWKLQPMLEIEALGYIPITVLPSSFVLPEMATTAVTLQSFTFFNN